MSDEQKYDAEWSVATLTDALEALQDLIAEIEDSPEEVKEILDEGIINVYAKLNYAYHSAEDGPEALMQMSDDDIISFPPVLPMFGTSALCPEKQRNN